MFGELIRDKKKQNDAIKYAKNLGWNAFDEYGDKVEVSISVIDVELGYNIYRLGSKLELLNWFPILSEAVEWGVDRARQEIADHKNKEKKDDEV